MDRDLGTVEIERLGDSLWVLQLAGEHDLSTGPTIEGAFERMAETGTTVVVDFTEASFIDSTVAGALIKRARSGETLLLVVPKNSAASRTLDLVGLTGVLRSFETRDQALQAVPPEDLPTCLRHIGPTKKRSAKGPKVEPHSAHNPAQSRAAAARKSGTTDEEIAHVFGFSVSMPEAVAGNGPADDRSRPDA